MAGTKLKPSDIRIRIAREALDEKAIAAQRAPVLYRVFDRLLRTATGQEKRR